MTQFNTTGYSIERPTGQCALTGEPIVPGSAYVATLVEVEAEGSAAGLGLKRVDVSEAAWNADRRPENLFSFWKTVAPLPSEKKKVFVDDTVLCQLLLRLEDADQPQRLAFRFVLALILLRKKLLRYDGTVKETGADGAVREFWKVTPKLDPTKGPMSKWDDSGAMRVLNPDLDEDRIVEVTEQLGEVLEAEL